MASSIIVYTITYILLKTGDNADGQITRQDAATFGIIALVIIGVGSFFTILFQLMVKENRTSTIDIHKHSIRPIGEKPDDKSDLTDLGSADDVIKWSSWLKDGRFYKVGLLYVASRFYYNLTQTYTPLFLQYTLKTEKVTV